MDTEDKFFVISGLVVAGIALFYPGLELSLLTLLLVLAFMLLATTPLMPIFRISKPSVMPHGNSNPINLSKTEQVKKQQVSLRDILVKRFNWSDMCFSDEGFSTINLLNGRYVALFPFVFAKVSASFDKPVTITDLLRGCSTLQFSKGLLQEVNDLQNEKHLFTKSEWLRLTQLLEVMRDNGMSCQSMLEWFMADFPNPSSSKFLHSSPMKIRAIQDDLSNGEDFIKLEDINGHEWTFKLYCIAFVSDIVVT